jgi:ATPase family associated with various cellular activities (AAA)
MRREPSLTLEGALKILGHYEPRWIKRLDNLLGGVILAGGATTALLALGVTPLAPVAAFGLVWGWVEQKGVAIDLLTKTVKSVAGKLNGTQERERRELIAAAHSVIVVAALFEALRDHLGEEAYHQLRITDSEKESLLNQMGPRERDGLVDICMLEIPAPSAARGFEENVPYIRRWQMNFAEQLRYFLNGLAAAENLQVSWYEVQSKAIERYRSHYVELAVQVPEFAIWAWLGEHAATRAGIHELGSAAGGAISNLHTEVAGLRSDVAGLVEAVAAVLRGRRDALGGVAALLGAGISGAADSTEVEDGSGLDPAPGSLSVLRAAVHRANMGVLEEPVIPADPDRYPSALTIPRVSEIYVNPRYRVVEYVNPRYRVAELDDEMRPANDGWWATLESHDDFDVLLARHVTTPDATRRPLVLLGHPGAGKSLLTKVFAAQLPVSKYTVVRVPLRRVSADARIDHQIEEALHQSTNRPIAWWELAEQSEGTIRVVILDGLDELLQASDHDRSSYLQDVMDFQEREAQQRRPVVAVVTSRTVVADRVDIPDGATVVKLDPFNNIDIADWLRRWRRANTGAIDSNAIGELSRSVIQRQPELAEQPLLLLMMAIYAADPDLPMLHDEMTTAEFYRRLLDGYARREVAKEFGLGRDPFPDEIEQHVRDQLDALSVAALGMFNRGRQDISEEQLGKDLETLEPRLMARTRPTQAGRRVIGSYFFVHVPEARISRTYETQTQQRGGPGARESRERHHGRQEEPLRAYEFLHATFGEYLAARRIMDQLIEISRKAAVSRRGPEEPEDDLLIALLSHQTLAPRNSMLNFVAEIFSQLSGKESESVREVLELLIAGFRTRHDSVKFAAYQPGPGDRITQLAFYSANLVILRLAFDDRRDGMPLAQLLRTSDDLALDRWRSMVMLWKAGLDGNGMSSMLSVLHLVGTRAVTIHGDGTWVISDSLYKGWLPQILLARLCGESESELRLRYGAAITDAHIYFADWDPGSLLHVMASSLISVASGRPSKVFLVEGVNPLPDRDAAIIADLAFRALRAIGAGPETRVKTVGILRFLLRMPSKFKMDRLTLAAIAIADPQIMNEVPELRDPQIFGPYAQLVSGTEQPLDHDDTDHLQIPESAVAAMRSIIRDFVKQREGTWEFTSGGLPSRDIS